jgi:hypothetical protein
VKQNLDIPLTISQRPGCFSASAASIFSDFAGFSSMRDGSDSPVCVVDGGEQKHQHVSAMNPRRMAPHL